MLALWFAPTVWLYLTPGLLTWLLLRRRPQLAASAVLVVLALVGFAGPALMNLRVNALLDAAVADDRGGPVPLGSPGTIAWLDASVEQPPYCSYDCMRFLITGHANAVLLGWAGDGPPEAARSMLQIHLAPRRGNSCPLLAPDAQNLFYGPFVRLLDPDRCLVVDRAPLGTADLVFSETTYGYRRNTRLPGWPLFWRRQEAYAWDGGEARLLTRRTDVKVHHLTMPLRLWPLSCADSCDAAQWGLAPPFRAGTPLPLDRRWIVADSLHVPEFDEPR